MGGGVCVCVCVEIDTVCYEVWQTSDDVESRDGLAGVIMLLDCSNGMGGICHTYTTAVCETAYEQVCFFTVAVISASSSSSSLSFAVRREQATLAGNGGSGASPLKIRDMPEKETER
jgi:hypothetical protein